MAPSVVISYETVVQLRSTKGKCLDDNWEVMLKVALRDLPKDLASGKEGRSVMKIGTMSREKSNLVLEIGRFKHTGQCLAHLDMNVLIEGMKSLNVCGGW